MGDIVPVSGSALVQKKAFDPEKELEQYEKRLKEVLASFLCPDSPADLGGACMRQQRSTSMRTMRPCDRRLRCWKKSLDESMKTCRHASIMLWAALLVQEAGTFITFGRWDTN